MQPPCWMDMTWVWWPWGTPILWRVRRASWVTIKGHQGEIVPVVNRFFGYRNMFVHFEYCASPLRPFDLLPSPKDCGTSMRC